jgi:hypothetical protein
MTYNWNLSPEANRAKTEAQIRRKIYAPPPPTPLTTTQEKKIMTPLANALYLSPAEIEAQLGESAASPSPAPNPLYTPKPAAALGQKPKPACTKCGRPIDAHAPDCKYNPEGMKARAEAAIQAAPKPAPAPAPAPASPMTWTAIAKELKAEHLQGRPRTLTISNLSFEKSYSGDAKIPTLHFREQPQFFSLTQTNQTALLKLFGDDVRACIGKKITIAPVKWGRKMIARIMPGRAAEAALGEPEDITPAERAIYLAAW